MLTTLIQEIPIPTRESLEELLRSHPIDWEGLAERLSALPQVYILALVVAGLALLVAGYKIYRLALVLSGIVAGAIIGVTLGRAFDINPLILAIICAVVMGLLAFPLQKVLFFVAGGAIGVILVAPTLSVIFKSLGDKFWPLWLFLGFIIIGVLTVLLFKQIVIIATAIEGAVLVSFGCVMLIQGTSKTTPSMILHPPLVILILILLLAMFGVVTQVALEQKKGAPPKEPPQG